MVEWGRNDSSTAVQTVDWGREDVAVTERPGLDLPPDPDDQNKILDDVLEMSDELEIPLRTSEQHYKQLTEKPEPPVRKEGLSIGPAPTPTGWEKFKSFFVSDRPALPPDADRIEKVTRAVDIAISAPLRGFLKFGKGMTLGAPDVMWAAIKRITPDDIWIDEVKRMNLDEAMDWAGGYNPSGFQKSVGEVAEFVGRIRSVEPIAKHLGIIGKTPKDISVLGKAAETAKLFGTAAVGEQTAKLAATVIDPSEAEFGFEGPKAVLRDMAIGAIFSLASQGVRAGVRTVWSKLTPTEQARALKTLGLKKGATDAEINQAARDLARTYHPDKAKGFEEEFKKVIDARTVLRRGETADVVFRGAKVTVEPKLLPAQAEAALAKLPPEHPLGTKKIDAIVARIRASGETKQMTRAQQQRFDADIAALDAEVEAIQRGAVAERLKGVKGEKVAAPTVTPETKEAAPAAEEGAIKAIEQRASQQGIKLDAFERAKSKEIHVSKIIVPEGERGQGLGTQVMQEIIDRADDIGFTVTLTPSTDFGGTSIARLKRFYKRLGFVENKGKNKDLSISETMFRLPQQARPTTASAEAPAPVDPDTTLAEIPEKQRVNLRNAEAKNIRENDVYKLGLEGRGAAKDKFAFSKVRFPPGFEGEIAATIGDFPHMKFKISTKQTFAGHHFDEALEEIGEPDMDVLEFLQRMGNATKSPKVGVLDSAALDFMVGSGDPDAVLSAYKYEQLLGGQLTAAELNANIQEVASQWPEMPQEAIESFFVETGDVGAKAKEGPEAVPGKAKAPGKEPKKGPKEVTLTAGFDPGLKEFVSQSLKPAVIDAAAAAKAAGKIVAAIPQYSADVFLQPSLELERKSPEAYVSVIKSIHTATDVARLDFENIQLEALDLNVAQARKYFKDNFTKDEHYDFVIAFAGQPGTPDAAQIQKAAFDRLPENMKDPKLVAAMRELSDKNYDYLVKVVGPNVHYIPDYFYGVFESSKEVDKFWKHWTSTDKFTKKKTIPSVADAIMFGLEAGKPIELKQKNFIDNLMNEYLGIAKLDGMQTLKKELVKTGSAGTSKPASETKKAKKKGTPVERRAAKLAEIYGSAEEALRLQNLQDKVSGKPLTQQEEATRKALKALVAQEKAAKAKGVEPPPPGGAKQSPLEEFDSLRARSEAEDPDVYVIHPEDASFYITEDPVAAPAGWVGVADPVFRGAWLRPDLARVIDNLTATNKITQDGILNAVRTANNFTRSLTFFGSAFHLKTVTGAAIADSGWGGPLLHSRRALKPFRNLPSTKQWEKTKQTPEFKRLLGLGVGLGHSAEEDAARTMTQFADYLEANNVIGATGKLIEGLALRLPLAFQKWQFDVYIPMLKHAANMDEWALLEKRTGRPATDGELIDIIKATQNLFGEMNERTLGRSATQTTGSRFVAKAPGFAEGNVRTNIDAATKFSGERGYTRGRRARSQIVNSLMVKAFMATAGTLWLTGKLPKWVSDEKFEKQDFADIFKIDTGQVDGRGRRIMINTLDSDKDYLDLWFNMFTVRPDRALYKAFNRLGGMKSTLADFVYDGLTSLMRQDIRDWKGDKVFSLSDTPEEKLWKYTLIALERLEPISKNVFDQMRYKEISLVQSFLGAISGVRSTWSELDKRKGEFYRLIHEQKADLEVLDIEILSKPNPRAAYEEYNKDVERILNSRYLPEGFKEEYGPELRRNVDDYLQNKAFAASHLAPEGKAKDIAERSAKILKHFGVTAEQSVKLLRARKARMAAQPKRRAHPLESQPIIGDMLKEKRLRDRISGKTKE